MQDPSVRPWPHRCPYVKADIDPSRKPEAVARAERILADSLKTARLSDLTPERIQSALAKLRDAGKALQTVNHYRAALRAFSLWAGDTGRIRENPMRGVKGFNVEEDIRHARRSLTNDELARLIESAERGPERSGMPGPLRAMAYRVAATSGFRVDEIRKLTPESFRAIRADLAAVGIDYETNEGVADFHTPKCPSATSVARSNPYPPRPPIIPRHWPRRGRMDNTSKNTLAIPWPFRGRDRVGTCRSLAEVTT